MKLKRLVAIVASLALLGLSLMPELAFAGTTGNEFQSLYQKLYDWATGYLGKAIAVAAFLLGLGMGVAKSSPVPALVGIVFALFIAYVPTIIGTIVGAVV